MNGRDAIEIAIGFALGYYFVSHLRKTGKGY